MKLVTAASTLDRRTTIGNGYPIDFRTASTRSDSVVPRRQSDRGGRRHVDGQPIGRGGDSPTGALARAREAGRTIREFDTHPDWLLRE
ncbi:hypothetical protein D8S78_24245 [Natrialba swarupiae]|nr:hypothetical protein [Natrialba swarupiae]